MKIYSQPITSKYKNGLITLLAGDTFKRSLLSYQKWVHARLWVFSFYTSSITISDGELVFFKACAVMNWTFVLQSKCADSASLFATWMFSAWSDVTSV